LPYDREGSRDYSWYHHIGVYSYRPKALLTFVKLPMGKLEYLEKNQLITAEHSAIIIHIDIKNSPKFVQKFDEITKLNKSFNSILLKNNVYAGRFTIEIEK
jgi:3-deoxy-manno-octulosonate cytidylyltransferase (CMP-KDO synthetase)